MAMVVMSKRELNRLDVLARLDSGKLTARAAAELMVVTIRQTYQLLRRYRDGGASAVANQRRGRSSNNRLPDVVRDHAIALVRERYADFGPTFEAEKLAERHDLKVSRETLRSWMRQAGSGWMARAERIQQPRHRREHIGELVEIDGSEHRWFEDRAAGCTLLVFVDDATSRLMELRFQNGLVVFAEVCLRSVARGSGVVAVEQKSDTFNVAAQAIFGDLPQNRFEKSDFAGLAALVQRNLVLKQLLQNCDFAFDTLLPPLGIAALPGINQSAG